MYFFQFSCCISYHALLQGHLEIAGVDYLSMILEFTQSGILKVDMTTHVKCMINEKLSKRIILRMNHNLQKG